VAAIGTLPLPLMHRSIVVPMVRHDGQRELKASTRTTPTPKPTSPSLIG
jgi:hypothetical protein